MMAGWYTEEQIIAAHRGIRKAFAVMDDAGSEGNASEESVAHALMTLKFCESAVNGSLVDLSARRGKK